MDKASLHGGRGSARHNSRAFVLDMQDVPENIDFDRMMNDNRVFVLRGGVMHPVPIAVNLEELEIAWYGENMAGWIEARNGENVRKGRSERCAGAEQIYRMKRYEPHEDILQLGNLDHCPISAAELLSVVMEMERELMAKYPGYKCLSVSMHADEATPHCHNRWLWGYRDNQGNFRPGLEKGLEVAGIPLPEPDKPTGRYNNRLMAWTAMRRERFIELLRGRGYDIDDRPQERRRHKDKATYVAGRIRQQDRELGRLESAVRDAEDELEGYLAWDAREERPVWRKGVRRQLEAAKEELAAVWEEVGDLREFQEWRDWQRRGREER